MPEFSIVTIVKGRRKQLTNLLKSIKNSSILPVDIQIVCIDEPIDIIIPNGLYVNIQRILNTHPLPLAAARNLGFKSSETEDIIFIDVDCMVSPTLFENILNALHHDKIISAYPLYLPFVPEHENYPDLLNCSVSHPAREHIPSDTVVDHLQFWSLIFAVKKMTFEKTGGFDESFIGYGAEDTDFAMGFHKKGIKHIFIKDFVLHQYHDKYDPPLNHFDSIIENAQRYRKKWGALPMQRWLKAFEKINLITIDHNQEILVLKKPTEDQINNSVSSNPY
ncbi:glycosyltransferase family 2 protein [Chryseobacterium foetidum]|uniref:glycosyltransferase family 2 protein n=1 Tax=Chryseobacterium foetidum TaxID=2951057 RepID=UPI0021CA90CD|nr:galactosyltransferase-related protein [Chryseobacterium foetidum]